MLLRSEDAYRFASELLEVKGLPTGDARSVAEALVTTSLRGIDTHGIRLLPIYSQLLDSGKAKANPQLQFTQTKASVLHIDADFSLGQVGALRATDSAVKIAKKTGIALVSVGSANHFGASGYFASKIAFENCLGLVFTNTDAQVAPFQGKHSFFGTNPLAIAVKGEADQMFCLDMATSQTSFSAVQLCKQTNKPLQRGWAIDAAGIETTDPLLATSLQPLGGYKGSGLAMAIELLCTLFAGTLFDHQLGPLYDPNPSLAKGVGQVFIAIDLDSSTRTSSFKARVTNLLTDCLSCEPSIAGERVIYPGEQERVTMELRLKMGIPVDDKLFLELNQLANINGIKSIH